jgi:hypothetical protein
LFVGVFFGLGFTAGLLDGDVNVAASSAGAASLLFGGAFLIWVGALLLRLFRSRSKVVNDRV